MNAATDPVASGPAGRDTTTQVIVWGARLAWLALALVGGAAFGDALSTRSRAVQVTATVVLWVAWSAVAVAMAIPSTVGLTVVRSVAPASVVVAAVAAFEATDTADRVLCIALAIVSTALVSTGEYGQAFAQASAYGDERRFVLRPPVAYLVPVAVTWCVLCALAISAPLLLAARAWAAGVPVVLALVALGWFLGRRFHRLSRRWIVVVPAGVVVHDHLVLAETAMFPRADVASVGLALEGTGAADLTGPAAGLAVEISLRDTQTVVLAPTRVAPRGTALHVRAVLVAPSRPGRLLAEVSRRRLPTSRDGLPT